MFTGERTFRPTPADGGTVVAMTETDRGLLAGLCAKAIPDMTDSFGLVADGLKAAAEGPSG